MSYNWIFAVSHGSFYIDPVQHSSDIDLMAVLCKVLDKKNIYKQSDFSK